MTLTYGSLCSGYGGLDRAVEEHYGATCAWHAEVDPSCSGILARRWPDTPNLGDLTAVDWDARRAWPGTLWAPEVDVTPVDVLTAGYPCQPFSHAGTRKGSSDERHLWPYIADAIASLRPGRVVLENVDGHRSLGAAAVVSDLARLGYVGRWGVVRAAHAGAPHRRARWWCVASDAERQSDELRRGPGPVGGQEGGERLVGGRSDPSRSPLGHSGPPAPPAPDADLSGRQGCGAASSAPDDRGADRSDASGTEPADGRGAWGAYGPAVVRWGQLLGRGAPHAVDGRRRLSPHLVEWMMGLPAGWVTDIVRNRGEALRVLGNGVVPQQARLALALLDPQPGSAPEVLPPVGRTLPTPTQQDAQQLLTNLAERARNPNTMWAVIGKLHVPAG